MTAGQDNTDMPVQHIELLFETMARHRVDEPWLFNINERLQYKRHSSIYGIVFLFKCFIENCIHSVSMYMLVIQKSSWRLTPV